MCVSECMCVSVLGNLLGCPAVMFMNDRVKADYQYITSTRDANTVNHTNTLCHLIPDICKIRGDRISLAEVSRHHWVCKNVAGLFE